MCVTAYRGLCTPYVQMYHKEKCYEYVPHLLGQEIDLSFIPVLAVVFFGISITASFVALLRFLAGRKLIQQPPSADVLQLVAKQRKKREECGLKKRKRDSSGVKKQDVDMSGIDNESQPV